MSTIGMEALAPSGESRPSTPISFDVRMPVLRSVAYLAGIFREARRQRPDIIPEEQVAQIAVVDLSTLNSPEFYTNPPNIDLDMLEANLPRYEMLAEAVQLGIPVTGEEPNEELEAKRWERVPVVLEEKGIVAEAVILSGVGIRGQRPQRVEQSYTKGAETIRLEPIEYREQVGGSEEAPVIPVAIKGRLYNGPQSQK